MLVTMCQLKRDTQLAYCSFASASLFLLANHFVAIGYQGIDYFDEIKLLQTKYLLLLWCNRRGARVG